MAAVAASVVVSGQNRYLAGRLKRTAINMGLHLAGLAGNIDRVMRTCISAFLVLDRREGTLFHLGIAIADAQCALHALYSTVIEVEFATAI